MLDFDPGLTRTEAILGTPNYMSPEQAEGKHAEVGVATDVYALGAIFYELLTGRPPFRAATMLQTLELVPPMAHPAPVVSADIGPRNEFLVTVDAEGSTRLWDLATSRPIGPPHLPRSRALGAVFRPDGRSFVIATADGSTLLGKVPEPIRGDPASLALRFRVRTCRQIDNDKTLAGLNLDAWHRLNARLSKQTEGAPRP